MCEIPSVALHIPNQLPSPHLSASYHFPLSTSLLCVVSGSTRPRHKMTVKRSEVGTTCILYRVVPREGVDLSTFTQDSDGKDFILEPVLRSFDKKPWQPVAGPYSNRSRIFRCRKENCIVNFRVNRGGTSKYVLMTSSSSFQSVNEERARFLQQATFGPKMSEITGWTFGNGEAGFAAWMKNQMDVTQTPMTSQREYYREHLDWSMIHEEVGLGSVTPMDPCSQYSRWRDYAFTGGGDFGKEFTVEEIVVDGVTKYLIKVGDEPRTVVDSFASTDAYYSGPGTYQLGQSICLIHFVSCHF